MTQHFVVRIGRVLWRCAVSVSCLVGSLALAVPASAAAPTVDSVQEQARQVTDRPRVLRQLRLLNLERVAVGLRPVRLSPCLQADVAQPWAAEMAGTGNFAHQDLAAVASNCPRFGWAGENIAYGYRTPREVMVGWMNTRTSA
jgi:uncharacterized protein YkwD